MTDLVRREAATRKTFAKYQDRAFSWGKRATCIHMARTHLRNMGHRPPSVPDFRSLIGARGALRKTGFEDLAGLLDSLLPRITPAAMLVGDIAILPGDDDFESIVISSGSKLVGYHGDDPSGIKPHLLLRAPGAAWRD